LTAAQQARVRRIMSSPAITARPEMSVETVAELLLSHGLSRLPVVDDQGKLVGMISKTELLAEQIERREDSDWTPEAERAWQQGVPLADQGFHLHQPGATMAEVMKPAQVTVTETTTIAQAAKVMAIHRLHGVPVVSPDGNVTGMLSLLDIVGWVAGLA